MKKLTIIIVSIIGLVVILLGCSKTNDFKEKTKDVVVLECKLDDERLVIENFTAVLNRKDILMIKEFILNNIEKVSKENADRMVEAYEDILVANYEDISNRCVSGKYRIIIEEAKNSDGSLDFQKVKNEEYRKEVKDIIGAGYVFKMAEGDYCLYIDYAMINDKFSEYLSPKLKPYYDLRKRELNNPMFIGEYLNIGFKEVKERVITLEKFIKDNKEFKNRDDLNLLMKRYILGLLTIDSISKTVNSDTGKVEEIVKVTYAELKESDLIISKQAAMAMDSLLEKYNYVIKRSDKEATKKVNKLKFKICECIGEANCSKKELSIIGINK